MAWIKSSLAWIFLAYHQYEAAAAPTWPSATDELEDLMLLNSGYHARGFASNVIPCGASPGTGRNTAAEWIRTAFHDMAPGNTYTGVGGLDASLVFETQSGENAGAAFASTLTMFAPFLSSRTSMADIIAMGVYSATRSCGGPVISIRAGRIDATAAGPLGVPLPQNAVGTFKNQFLRTGYNATEMIQFVACGHTLGGVHSSNFPEIVPANSAPDGTAVFDTTSSGGSAAFDSKVAVEYVTGTTKNPLVVGLSVGNTRNSDGRVYASDNNVTIKAMQDPVVFADVCKNMFQKMVEVVPKGITLTDPITPYDIKPYDLQLTLLDGGSQLSFTGDIRIRTTQRSASQIALVQLVYKDRTGATTSTPIATTHKGDASGFDDTFTFYGFSTKLSADISISSFNVVITKSGGATETWDNNGNGFKVDDTVIFQSPQSCLDGTGRLTVVAAIRNGAYSPNLQVVVKNPRASPVVVPALSTATAAMATQSAVGSYQLYSASYTLPGSQSGFAVFGVLAGSASDNYKTASQLPSACSTLGTSPPTATPSSPAVLLSALHTNSSVSSMARNATAATLSTRPAASKEKQTATWPVDGYNYLGCYSEGSVVRALSDTNTANNGMTVEKCATFCDGANYFGLEYGQECYCGAVINTGSVIKNDTDCSMTCAGNVTEYCGAGNRLNIYQKSGILVTSTPTPSSSFISSSSTSPTPSADTTTVLSSSSTFLTSTVVPDTSSSISAPDSTTNTPISSSPLPSSSSSSIPSSVSPISSAPTTPSSGLLSNIISSTSLSSSAIPSSSSTPTSTSTPTGPSLPGYTYLGCLSDSVTARTLSSKSRPSTNNTYLTCSTFCSGYLYFGVEYSNECYCGDVLQNSPSTAPESDCNMPCSGLESTGNCGAGSRMNIFQSLTVTDLPSNPVIEGYAYAGCYTDEVGSRTLAGEFLFAEDMTVEKCKDFCKGTQFFGTEYGGECYCGASLGGAAEKRAESECGYLCKGNEKEFCGAGGRLTVYKKGA
ncbi:hypothetical protein BCR34DRAFT_647305 [Clohesyomyces aquaticus]|uniref:Heme peroxidase n=1 Tax=Clohesyomyces aquaticus TaxID=1231657 RepID=A0A1Y1ZV00_9PLEO|nr:hypothetical protein BCR34DRAFT_647305 [Clohesyomyces aquaticus]